MTSWKTTLGGALAALGTFLWGAPVAMKAMEVPIEPAIIKWCVIAGLVASAAGVFFMGLFGRDNNVTSEDVQRAAEEKKRNGGFNLFVFVLLGLLAFGAFTACKTPKLEPGGAYAPTNSVGQVVRNDLGLALADASYKLAYETTLSVFRFERENRADIQKLAPGVKVELDKLRPKVVDIDKRWALARQAYKANPTPAGLTTVQTILAEVQRLLPVVQSQLAPVNSQLVEPATVNP